MSLWCHHDWQNRKIAISIFTFWSSINKEPQWCLIESFLENVINGHFMIALIKQPRSRTERVYFVFIWWGWGRTVYRWFEIQRKVEIQRQEKWKWKSQTYRTREIRSFLETESDRFHDVESTFYHHVRFVLNLARCLWRTAAGLLFCVVFFVFVFFFFFFFFLFLFLFYLLLT